MTKQSPIPAKYPRGVILKWNSQANLATVPESAFPKESRHAIAALKCMTNAKAPNWEGALAIICVAIENYAKIRNDPNIYEYVNDRSLSQFLKWELVRFLDVNQPLRRLRKDKKRLPVESRVTVPKSLGKEGRAFFKELAKRCEGCVHDSQDGGCTHPEHPHSTGYEAGHLMNGKYGCHVPKEGQ